MFAGRTLSESSAAPAVSSRENWRVHATLRAIALTLLCACFVVGGVVLVFLEDPWMRLRYLALVMGGAAGSILLARRGRVREASLLVLFTLGGAITGGLAAVGSVYTPAIIGYPIVVMTAGLLLGSRSAIAAALLAVGILGLLAYGQSEEAL